MAFRERGPTPSARSFDQWGGAVGLGLIIVLSAQLLGGAHWIAAIAICAGVALLSTWRRRDVTDGWSLFATVFAGLALWTLVSVVPLPLDFVSKLSPKGGEIWSRALLPFSSPAPKWVTLSLDAFASFLEAAKWFSYALVCALATNITRRMKSSHQVLLIVFGSAIAIGLITALNSLTGLNPLFGWYVPRVSRLGGAVGPLLNPNTLAGYANLGAFSGIALYGRRERSLPPPVIVLGVMGCIATTVLSGSRGGIGCLLLGLVAAAMLWRDRSGSPIPQRSILESWGPLLAVIPAVVFAVALAQPKVRQEFEAHDLSKLKLIEELFAAARDFWLVGCGRGASGTISGRYMNVNGNAVSSQIENFVLSWGIEWGLPVALAALLTIAWLLRPSRLRLNESRSSRLLWVGLLVFAAQNLLDLALELPAHCLTVAALLGFLEGMRGRLIGTSERNRTRWPIGNVLTPVVIAGCFAALLAAVALGPDVLTARERIHAQLEEKRPWSEARERAYWADLRQQIIKRPSEPYFAVAGAVAAAHHPEASLAWPAAAIERGPHLSNAHFLLATALYNKGALNQALMHLKFIAGTDLALWPEALKLATHWTQSPEALERIVPDGERGVTALLALGNTLSGSNPKASQKFLEEAHRRAPTALNASATLAHQLIVQLKIGSPIPEQLEHLLSEIERDHPAHCEGPVLRARLHGYVTGPAHLGAPLAKVCNNCEGTEFCLREAFVLSMRASEWAETDHIGERYLSFACVEPTTCVLAETLIGANEEARGDWSKAFTHLSHAATLSGSGDHWLRAARAAARSGQIVAAHTALREAERLGSRDPELSAELAARPH